MPHECRPRCPQCPRAPQHAPPSTPPPWRKACPTAARPPPALCALAHGTPRRSPASSCVFSPDPVTTPGHPVPGGCVRGGRQTKSRPRDDPGVPRPRGMRARGAPGRTAPTPTRGDHGQHSHPQCPALLPRRPRGTPWRTCRPHRPPQPASHPAPRRRRADTRTDAVPHTRAGRRATWTAHDDYLLVLSSTHTSCQRHRRARVVTRHRLWRQHRPSATTSAIGHLAGTWMTPPTPTSSHRRARTSQGSQTTRRSRLPCAHASERTAVGRAPPRVVQRQQ